jgi:hypothetical protein
MQKGLHSMQGYKNVVCCLIYFLLSILLVVSASIMQGPNGLQPPVNTIKLENPGYYCNSYTPPAPEHTSMMASGAYSK